MIEKQFNEILFKNYHDFKIIKIESGASKRKYFRLKKGCEKYILMDSSKEPKQFENFLKIHKILSKINISIPKIYEYNSLNKVILLEDFGNLRFDKILNNSKLKVLLKVAIDSLLEINNNIKNNKNYNLSSYSYKLFKKEISEFVDYFYPYYKKKNMSLEIKEEFYYVWKKQFNLIEHDFTKFIHKDFNLNNLIYLPKQSKHKRCGIIDFQNSFWGDDSWDLFSLLEDSRILFSNKYNDAFIKYFYSKTNQKCSLSNFFTRYHFFNCSRQTRLLGRWIKLSKQKNSKFYLNFIKVTNKRLLISLNKPHLKNIKKLYCKLIPELYV